MFPLQKLIGLFILFDIRINPHSRRFSRNGTSDYTIGLLTSNIMLFCFSSILVKDMADKSAMGAINRPLLRFRSFSDILFSLLKAIKYRLNFRGVRALLRSGGHLRAILLIGALQVHDESR